MQIIAHRGDWTVPTEKNSRLALNQALLSGWGIETDIRDLNGELVISHDMALAGCLSLETVLLDYCSIGSDSILALNIKSDGLANKLKILLHKYSINNYFCFDMSVPDTLSFINTNMVAAARLSEYETEGLLSDMAPVLWIDGFEDMVLDKVRLRQWLFSGKKVCLVSPELHAREPWSFWGELISLPEDLVTHQNIMLCTDLPFRAEVYFK